MNKYTELSDFEINKMVAEKLGITHECDMGTVIIYRDSEHHAFDPCNNPSDAMPIIVENGIAIIPFITSTPVAFDSTKGLYLGAFVENENIYRAAMEVFLIMKEAENEEV